MNRKFPLIWTISLLLGFSGAWAEDEGEGSGDEAETTIRLMGAAEVELPTAVTEEIALPEALVEDSEAVLNAESGINTANENRARREEGLTTSDQARERGAEMTEEALENRENRGRSDDLPEGPDGPGVPQPPTG